MIRAHDDNRRAIRQQRAV